MDEDAFSVSAVHVFSLELTKFARARHVLLHVTTISKRTSCLMVMNFYPNFRSTFRNPFLYSGLRLALRFLVFQSHRERYSRDHDRLKALYYSKRADTQLNLTQSSLFALDTDSVAVMSRSDVNENLPDAHQALVALSVTTEAFREEDIDVPSGSYLGTLFVKVALGRREFNERELIALRAALCHGETFHESKIIVVNGAHPYASLYHVMNGHGQIIAYRVVEERGTQSMPMVMKAVARRYPKGTVPEIYTSDLSCAEQD